MEYMKQCKKSIKMSWGTEIITNIGKKYQITLDILASKIDDFQEDHIHDELCKFVQKKYIDNPQKKK